MTLHKLTAGDGYTYLTRQVASADETRAQGQSLADYYTARGNPPGRWMGRGATQLGLEGTAVSEAQMRALFGQGLHPDVEAMVAAGAPTSATRLGAAYPSYADLPPYAERVARSIEAFEITHGYAPDDSERNRIAAVEARRGRRAVAGFDLVFTPVKSVSLLWALSDPHVRAEVEAAHHSAVASTLAWVETHAAFTRTGHGGLAQVDTTGLVCAAFDHRDSRSGDPNLHTHVAVANKVCGVDGKWRALDARGLYALGVAASERYNTRIEDELSRRLGVHFADRPGGALDKRPVREVVGMPEALIQHFSRRRVLIEQRYAELHDDYRATHHRDPDRRAQLRLAQQATLETREGKSPGRTLAEQTADWSAQAREVLGEGEFDRLVAGCLDRVPTEPPSDTEDVSAWARDVVGTVSRERSTWSSWNVRAEAERRLRPVRFASEFDRDRATDEVVTLATGPVMSIRIAEPELVQERAQLLRDSDGQSVFLTHGSERFTTSEVLLAEESLVAAARSHDGPHLAEPVLEASLAIQAAMTGLELDPGQRGLVAAFATSPARLAVGIGPAGAGKTTAMRAFAEAWSSGRGEGRVVPLATSAKAAQVLGAELEVRAENLHKFLHESRRPRQLDDFFTLRRGDVVLVDEAGMAGTLQLAELLDLATDAGATVRLLGDPAQLAAVDTGGALQLIEEEVGASWLTQLHRFHDEDEGQATLHLRRGEPAALDFYAERGRITAGSSESMLDSAYDGWVTDVDAGLDSVLIAGTASDVTALNLRARTERVRSGLVEPGGSELHDGNTAGVGDWVVTRVNARSLRYSRHDRWVSNGDAWVVEGRQDDGALTLQHRVHAGRVTVPASYVHTSVELGYATTAHRVQGATTDTAHSLVTPEMTREALYVASTRGRRRTQWYVNTEPALDLDCDLEPDPPRTAHEVLSHVLARSGAESSATRTIRVTEDAAVSMPNLIGRYEHARLQAASDSLDVVAHHLPERLRTVVLADRAAPFLARVLADAAGRGAHPGAVLQAALDLEPLTGARSPALVLATRISDHPRTLGVPREAIPGPLPWVAPPDVGHPAWLPYLRERARLVEERAHDLGSLSAAYRDQYGVAEADGLGDPPERGSRREQAFRCAQREEQESATARTSGPGDGIPTPHQWSRTTQPAGQHLTR